MVANPRVIRCDLDKLNSIGRECETHRGRSAGNHVVNRWLVGPAWNEDSNRFRTRDRRTHHRKHMWDWLEFAGPRVQVVGPNEIGREMRFPFGRHPVMGEELLIVSGYPGHDQLR
jgi:hypothetical protein